MKIIDANNPNAAQQFADAIGAKPGDAIGIVTPQFTRTPGMTTPAAPPEDFEALRGRTVRELKELGMQPWDEPNSRGYVLMLFPGEWYSSIPAGYGIRSILDEDEEFVPGVTDDDIRYGCLSFGVLAYEDRPEKRAGGEGKSDGK